MQTPQTRTQSNPFKQDRFSITVKYKWCTKEVGFVGDVAEIVWVPFK